MASTFRKIALGIIVFAGILTIFFYLVVLPLSLPTMNREAVVILYPSGDKVIYVNDIVSVVVDFDPRVVGGEATGYKLICFSPDKVFLQEEVTGLSQSAPLAIFGRKFIVDSPVKTSDLCFHLTIRAEMTIASKTYYNELSIPVINHIYVPDSAN